MSSILALMDNTVRGSYDVIYDVRGPYNFKGTKPLSEELKRPDIKAYEVAMWHFQISECFKYDYNTCQLCPTMIDPNLIMIDGDKNIIYHSVSFSKSTPGSSSEIHFIRSVLEVHSILMKSILSYNGPRKYLKDLVLFNTVATPFYSTILSSSKEKTLKRTCESIEQFYDMMNLDMFQHLLNVLKNW